MAAHHALVLAIAVEELGQERCHDVTLGILPVAVDTECMFELGRAVLFHSLSVTAGAYNSRTALKANRSVTRH